LGGGGAKADFRTGVEQFDLPFQFLGFSVFQ
jgi:hypothetical protein